MISFAGGFPDPETFPRERVSALLQEFAAAGELSAFQYAPTRGLAGPLDAFADRLETSAGPPSRRRRAADHERRDRGARADREVVPRPRRRRRRRGADLPGCDPGVPELRGAARRRPAGRARARGRRAGATARRRAAPEARLHDPRPPEPGRRQPGGRAARAAGRAGAPLRIPDRRRRRLPRARLRRARRCRASGASPRTSSSRRARPRRRSAPAFGSAGPSGRPRSPPGSSRPSSSPTSARAPSASGSSRSRRAAAGSTSSWRCRAPSTGARASACWRRSSARCPRAHGGRSRRAASSPG